ncbi:MAG TPA: excalibur calcium-binding domain-containing protein [Candidatus Competibacteraceae bacterium]|nr:excalibur calcium-binding domain-containing protein [Candidatus Competibacteraceae bacterium]
MPPWEWRHAESGNAARQSSRQSSRAEEGTGHEGTWQCGTKSTCKQMSSCEEAVYFLKKCGLSRLDRDHDGIPCESLCR